MNVQEELDLASAFGEQLEDLIASKGSVIVGDLRDKLLLAYWSLAHDLNKSILALIRNRFYGGAFALLRPIVEAQTRAHVVLICADDIVTKINKDKYTVNFKEVGAEIDAAFHLEGFFDKFLNGARGALHSFTHSGLSQLGRRFSGNDLQAHYEDGEVIEVIHISGTAVWMVTNLLTKRFKFHEEAKTGEELFLKWGKRADA